MTRPSRRRPPLSPAAHRRPPAHKNCALIYHGDPALIYFLRTSATPAQAEQRGAAEVVGSSWRISRGLTEEMISQRLSRAQ